MIVENNGSTERVQPSEAVKNLQRYLRTLSYRYPEIPPPPVDGIFDETTRASLTAFQGLSGIRESGVADALTWDLLYAAYLDALFQSSEPLPLPVFPISPDGYVLKRGDRGFPVTALQYLLSELSTLYDFPIPVEIGGEFDERTERAVIEVQRLYLLPPTGTVDKRLWNYLVGSYRAEDAMREDTT